MSQPDSNNESTSLNDLDALGQSMGEGAAAGLAPLPARAAPAFLRFMPDAIRELWNKGANFNLDGTSGEITLDGFYKNGPMRLVLRQEGKKEGMVAIDKRGRETNIRGFDDLVELNYIHWRQANSQKNTYVQPSRPWLDAFLDKKKVKRQVFFVPADEAEGEGEAG